MVIFWVICTLLILVALVIILPSLLAKDAVNDIDREKINRLVYEKKIDELKQDLGNDTIDIEQFEIAKSDLHRTLIDDISGQKELKLNYSNKILPFIIVLAVPLVAIIIYLKLNNGLILLSTDFQNQLQTDQQDQMQSIENAISSLEDKLKKNPNDIDGWVMLGRSYLMLERYEHAIDAYQRANELSNSADPAILVSYGEARVFASGQKIDQRSRSLFEKALLVDPGYEKALWYAGLAAYQMDDYEASIKHWEKLIQNVPTEQQEVRSALEIYLNDAKQKAGIEVVSGGESSKSPVENTALNNKASITVNVSLSDALRNKITDTDILFIYARAISGPRMPLALVKLTAQDLPTTVILDDSVAMMPSMALSSLDQVEVVARISKSGQALMQSGDIFGKVQPVSTNMSETVDVIIDRAEP